MSRLALADDLRNGVVEEALNFAADIKELMGRSKAPLLAALERYEELAERWSPAEFEEVQRRCKFIRSQLANAEREVKRYDAAVKLTSRREGYPFLLPDTKEAV